MNIPLGGSRGRGDENDGNSSPSEDNKDDHSTEFMMLDEAGVVTVASHPWMSYHKSRR